MRVKFEETATEVHAWVETQFVVDVGERDREESPTQDVTGGSELMHSRRLDVLEAGADAEPLKTLMDIPGGTRLTTACRRQGLRYAHPCA